MNYIHSILFFLLTIGTVFANEGSGNLKRESSPKIDFTSKKNQAFIDSLNFSESELAILSNNPILDVIVRVDQAPYSFIDNIKLQGYFVEVLERMVKGTGIQINYEPREGLHEPYQYTEGNRFSAVTSVNKIRLTPYQLIGGTPYSLDTLVLNKRRGGIRVLKQLSKMNEVYTMADRLLSLSKRYKLSNNRIHTSNVNGVIRRVLARTTDYAIMDYARAQYHLKRDKISNLDVIRIKSLAPNFKIFEDQIGIAIDVNSPMAPILDKLYERIPQIEIKTMKKKWLENYKYQKKDVILPVNFDIHELNFLSQNKIIKYVASNKDAPFEYKENGEYDGFIKGILDLFSKTTGTKIEYIVSDAIGDVDKLDILKRHEAHFFKSSRPLVTGQNYFKSIKVSQMRNYYITRYDSPDVRTIDQLDGKTVGIIKVDSKYLSKLKPKLKVERFNTYRAMLKDLSNGILDVIVAPEWVLGSEKTKAGIHNLKINHWAKEVDQETSKYVNFRVSRNSPELVTILNKFIAALKAKDYLGLKYVWFGNEVKAIEELLAINGKSQEQIINDIAKVNSFYNLPEMPGLSNEEIGYLKSVKSLTVGVDSGWVPFSFVDNKKNGQLEGLSIDYLERVQESLNLKFSYVKTKNISGSLKLLDQKKVDLYASAIQAGKQIEKYQYCSPYGVYNFSYLVNSKSGTVRENQLNGKKVGVNKDYTFIEFLEKAYPEILFVKTLNFVGAVKKLQRGEIYAYIDLDPVLQYHLRNKNISKINFGGRLTAKAPVSFALPPDGSTELISIINKALSKISSFDRKLIEDQWFSVKLKVETVYDYTTLFLVIGFTVILTVIFIYWNSKLARLNQVIKEKELLSRSLLESTNAVPYNFDFSKGYFTYVAPQITKLLGYIPNDFTNYEEWGLLVHSEDRESVFSKRNTAFEKRDDHYSLEYRIKNRNGKYIWIKDMVTVIYEKNHVIALNGLLLDITIEKNQAMAIQAAKEAAESANRSKSQFLANMSHEIRTPLNPIIGLAHLALTSNPSLDQVKDYMGKIQASSKSLLRIINDILDLSKMEAEKLNLEQVPFDLTQLNERINSLYGVKSAEKNIKLEFEYDEDLNPLVIGDPLRLEQVIGNLVSNAIKFTDHGSVTLSIKTIDKGDQQETLRFIVKDTGLGIPESKLDKIFEVFTQADDSNTRTHGGTGLGLSICKKLITMMGGQLRAKSKDGHGSEFYFTLNFKTIAESDFEDHHESVLAKNAIPKFEKTKILLVEDNMINKQVAEELLKAVGLEISHVRNGQECVEAVMQGDYELVLMDIQMPVMDGFEATKRIRREERFADLPIIAMTAQAFASEKKESYQAGMNAHVTKPIDPNELYQTLSKFIKVVESKSIKPLVVAGNPSSLDHFLDIDAGISRLRGNSALYLNIISDFHKTYQGFDEELDHTLAQGKVDEANAKLHQLKGAAGNIGASKLFNSTNALEQCLKLKEDHAAILKDFQQIFLKSLESINSYNNQSKLEDSDPQDKELSIKHLSDLFDQLSLEIEQASPKALDTISELDGKVKSDQKEFVVAIKTSLDDFDFSEASKKLNELRSIH